MAASLFGTSDRKVGYQITIGGLNGWTFGTTLTDSSGNEIGTTAAPLVVSSGTGSSSSQIQGNVASGAADSGNPVKIGGMVSLPTSPTFTNGQRANLQQDARGNVRVAILGSGGTTGAAVLTPADALANSSSGLASTAFNEVFDGTNWQMMRGNGNGLVVQSALSSAIWNYAGVTGGITNTSDVVLNAAAGASLRNYCKSLQYCNTAAVASEIVIKDGSTVIWRGMAPASMLTPANQTFDPPLTGTANTAMNVAMITTATATRVSAQGYTGV